MNFCAATTTPAVLVTRTRGLGLTTSFTIALAMSAGSAFLNPFGPGGGRGEFGVDEVSRSPAASPQRCRFEVTWDYTDRVTAFELWRPTPCREDLAAVRAANRELLTILNGSLPGH
jgi:hypothetical protein